jgi:ATP-binding cassette subfamily C protein
MHLDTNFIGAGWRLLTTRQRFGMVGCLGVFVIASVTELIGLSSAMPFVLAVMDPTYVARSTAFRYLADVLGHPGTKQLLLWTGACVGGLIILGTLANLVATTLIEWYGVRIATHLADTMVRRTLARPYPWFLDKQAPLMAQSFIADPTTVGLALYPPAMELLYSLLFLSFAFLTIVYTLPGPTVLLLAILVAVSLGILWASHIPTVRFAETQREMLMYANKLGIEAVGGIKDIKIKARESHFSRAHNATVLASSMARLKLNMVNRSVPAVVNMVGQLGLLAVALTLLVHGSTPAELASQLTLLVLILGRTLPAASRMTGAVNKLASAKPSVLALVSLENDPEFSAERVEREKRPDMPENWKQVQFSDISFSYANADRPALSHVSLTFERNRFYGVVGPSGAGKSTLVDLLLGLLPPSSGQILIDGTDLSHYSQHSWFRKIGYVAQTPFIFNDTIRRNVAFGISDAAISDERVWSALQFAGLADVCKRLPDGLDTLMGDRGIRLSGGQRQRIAIARAVYDGPELLVLDEATSALDALTEREIQDTIAKLVGRLTVVAIAHRLSTVEMCDRLFVFDDSELVGQGRFDELMVQSPLFAKLANQFARSNGADEREAAQTRAAPMEPEAVADVIIDNRDKCVT